MFKQILVISLLALCISAKKHKQEPMDPFTKCLLEHCEKEVESCDDACFENIDTCSEDEADLEGCLHKNPNSFDLIMCAATNCGDDVQKVSKHAAKVIHKLARRMH